MRFGFKITCLGQLFGNEDKTEKPYETEIFFHITSVVWIPLVQPALQDYNLSDNTKENQGGHWLFTN